MKLKTFIEQQDDLKWALGYYYNPFHQMFLFGNLTLEQAKRAENLLQDSPIQPQLAIDSIENASRNSIIMAKFVMLLSKEFGIPLEESMYISVDNYIPPKERADKIQKLAAMPIELQGE